MSYEQHCTGPRKEPGAPWTRPGTADAGIDDVWRNPDESITAVQYKYTGSHHRNQPRRYPQDLLADCPECAGQHGPGHGDLSASNLTVAASGAYFSEVDPATVGEPMLVVIDDLEQHLNVGDLLRQLTPGPTVQVLVATRAQDDHLPPAGLSGAGVLDAVDGGKVTGLLTHWSALSRFDTLPPAAFETPTVKLLTSHLAVGTARCAVRAAYQTRQAVVQDPAASGPVVARFAETWLGLRPTEANIAATGNALLQAPLDGAHPDGDHAVVRRLGADVRGQRRAWRLIGETQLCGHTVDSLDRPLTNTRVDSPWTVADTVDSARPDTDDGWNDPRLPRVLARLHPDELRVTMSKAHDGLTWSAAALACGKNAEFGERVRCKLKRLGAELTARIEAAKAQPRLA